MATKYWVGNGGNWTDSAHWSLSSGGSGGASVPTIEDSVIFDANSITIDDQTVIAYMYPNFYCNGLDFSNIAVSFTFSLSSQSLRIAGGILRLSSLLVLTFISYGGSIIFVADSCEFYCNGYTGRLQLGAGFDSSAGTVKPSVVCCDSITSRDFSLLLDECDFTTDVIITSLICIIYCRELTVLNLLASDITCSASFRLVVYPTTAVNSSASITVGSLADFRCYNAELLEAPITFFNHLIFDPSVGGYTYAELSFSFYNSVYNSYAGKVYGNTIQVLPGFTNFYFKSYSNFSDVYLHLNDLSVCGSLEQQLSWEIEQSSRSITRILIDSGAINTEYTTLKGICASGAVPTGLSNVCVGGIASAFSTSSGYDPADAFDNVHDTDWEGVGLPNWLQYDLGAGASKTVERYMLIPWNQYSSCCTKWNFEGSNDGLSWNVLDSQDNTSCIGGFVIDNPVSYRFYRINIFEAGESGSPDLTEFRMFEGSEYKDGATFYALTSNGCIDGGGNTGWLFTMPPPPAPKGIYNEGDHFAYAPGDSGGTAVWREASQSPTPVTTIHRPGCGYWFKEVGTVYGGEVGPWIPWNTEQKVEFNEGSKITKSPMVSGGTPVWAVGETGPAITDTHAPCGYWYSSRISYISLLPGWFLVTAWVGGTPRYETSFWTSSAKFIGGGSSHNEIVKVYSNIPLAFTSKILYGAPVVSSIYTSSLSNLSSLIDIGDSFTVWPSYFYSSIEYTNGVFVRVVLLHSAIDNSVGLYSFTSADQLTWSTSTLITIINPDTAIHAQYIVSDTTVGKFFDGSLFVIYPVYSINDYGSIYNKAFLMFISSNNGTSWSQVNTPDFVFSSEDALMNGMCVRVSETTYDLYVIRTKDDTDNTTYIWHTDDCGSSWNTNVVVGRIYAGPIELFSGSPGSSLVYAEGNLYGFILHGDDFGDEDVKLGYYVSNDHGVTWTARSEYIGMESIVAFVTDLVNVVNYSYIPDYTGAIVSGFMSGTITNPGTYAFTDLTSFFVSEDFGSSWKYVACKNYLAVSAF